jgi:hypothetical protein
MRILKHILKHILCIRMVFYDVEWTGSRHRTLHEI